MLRVEFPALNAAQLNHILTQYQSSPDVGCVPVWQPGKEDSLAAFRTGEERMSRMAREVLLERNLGEISEQVLGFPALPSPSSQFY